MAAVTVLRAAWLFDGTGSALISDPAVVIDGARIVAVTAGRGTPGGATIVDLAGATLLPGLVDTHVHLAFDASPDPVAALSSHVTFWTAAGIDAPEDLIRLIADRRIVAGLTMGVGSAPPFTTFAANPEVAARMPGIIATTRRLYQAGAVTAFASDAGISPAKPHDAVRRAPAALHAIGASQAEALRAVTSGNAAACGLGDRKGRIAPGFDADILVVDGDPIADPEALDRIRAVYARGALVPHVNPPA